MQKIKNFFSNGLVRILIITVLITIHFVYGIFLEEIASILGSYFFLYFSFLFYFWLLFTTIIIMILVNFMFDKLNFWVYNHNKESKENLYKWLGNDAVSEKFLIDLFNLNASNKFDVVDNLISIKALLSTKLNDDIVNYYLFKNYLEFKQKNNSFKKINVILSTLLVTFTTLVLSSALKPKAIELAKEFNIDYLFNNEVYSYFVIILAVGVSIYLLVGGIVSSFTETKRRINYLISILEVLIMDKENKNGL